MSRTARRSTPRDAAATGIDPTDIHASDDVPDGLEIGVRHGAAGPRAALLGLGLDIWEVIETLRLVGNHPARAARYLGIDVDAVVAALVYRDSNPQEIMMFLEEQHRRADEARRG